MQAARDNIKDPPGHLRQGRAREPARHAAVHRRRPAARLRATSTICTSSAISPTRPPKRRRPSAATSSTSKRDLAPRSKGSFRLGRETFEQKFKLDEGLTVGAERLLDDRHARAARDAGRIPPRRVAAERRRSDGRLAEGQGRSSAAPASSSPSRSSSSRSSSSSSRDERIISIPHGRAGRRRADAALLPLDVGEHVDARAVRVAAAAARSTTSPTSIPSWPPERQDEHLRDFNYGALWSISIHEVFPGHFLHYQHLRQVESKLRKSILFSSSAFVEGWAHYCEQMMIDEGFRQAAIPACGSDSSPRRSSASAAASSASGCTARTCRSNRRVRFFREEAFLEEPSARREAERGTFDPSYILYSAGKLMLLKLREDYKAQSGREVLAARIPRHAARQRHGADLAAPRADARRAERRDDRVAVLASCPSTSTSAKPAHNASSESRSSRIRSIETLPDVRRPGRASCCRRRRFSSRDRAGTSPTTRRRAVADRAAGRQGRGGASRTRRTSRTRQASRRSPTRPRTNRAAPPSTEDRVVSSSPPGGYCAAGCFEIDRAQVVGERLREIGPAQREIDDGLQEPELVARVVADAVDVAAVDRPILQQPAQAVGQLNLAGAIAGRRFERGEDVRREDVAADDREIRRRFLARRLLDQSRMR